MPVIDDESEAPDPNFLYAIAMARNIEHQVESKRIEKLRVTKLCGSVEDVTHAYTKLHEFCAATPSAEVPSLEKRWYGALESSGWLSLVQSCLMLAKMAAHSLCWKNMCTMLLEDEGRDLSAIVSCLTQLMVDPHFRSISGFEVLIQKEWVALGHPFTTRNALVFDTSSLDSEEGGIVAPVFLLFLDCVWQLSRQFPSAFEFSESYLLHLHDLQYSCLYSNFIFNCAKHRLQSSLQGRRSSYSISVLEEDSLEQGGEYEGPLLSAWGRWRATLSKEENEKCLNPFYYIFGSSDIHLDCRTTKSPTTFDTTHLNDVFSDTVPVIRTSDGLHPQNADTSLLKSSDDPRQFYQVGLLLPETSLCSIHIWSAFFFRHVPELRRINDQQLVKQDIENQFVREVRKLKDQLNELEASMGSFSSDLSSFIGEVIQVREQEMKEQTQANRKISLDTSAPFRRRLSAMLPDEIDFGFRKDATLFEKPISSRSKSPVFAQSSSLAEFQDVLYDRTPECQATPDASPLQDRKSPIRQVYSSIGSPSAPGGTGRSPVVKTRLRVKMEKPLDPNMAIQWSTSSTVPHQAAAPRHSPIVIGRVLTRKESLDMEEAMSSSTQLTEL